MGVRVREDYFSPHSNPRMALQINDVPSNWPLPETNELLEHMPDVLLIIFFLCFGSYFILFYCILFDFILSYLI